ncbi:IS66-like element accessory protein TnpA [Sphingomonas koreensis]
MSQVTVISGVERRRRWSDEEKRALVAAVSVPGANVAEIARQADLRPSQIYRWRRTLRADETGFAAVMVQPDAIAVASSGVAMVVEVGGATVRIAADAPPALVMAVMRSLRR